MLAEGGRDAAQARLAATHADRRGHALVPVLLHDIATVDVVGAGQGLVDRLDRAGGKASSRQRIAERRPTGRAERPAASSGSRSGSAAGSLNTAASSARKASRLAPRSVLRAKRRSAAS